MRRLTVIGNYPKRAPHPAHPQGGHPFLGKWAPPGGFVQPSETTEQVAARELREETGVDDVYLEQLYTFSDIGRDPRTWVMSAATWP